MTWYRRLTRVEPAEGSAASDFEVLRDGELLVRSDVRSLFESDLQPGRRYVYEVYAINAEGERSVAAAIELLAGDSGAVVDSPVQPPTQPPVAPPVDEPPVLEDPLQLEVPTNLPVLVEGADQPTRIEIRLNRPGARLSVREESTDIALSLIHI